MIPRDPSAYIPEVRPHNRLRDGKVFFLISSQPILELNSEEVLLYGSIDGRKTVAELEEKHPGARARLLKWYEAAIIELVLPITSPAGPHLVVIEPHMNDAALSAGGRLLHRRGRNRITILSVVKWSNFTSYMILGGDFLNAGEVTTLRQQESVLAAKLLGAQHDCLDWTDTMLRLWPADRWSSAVVENFRRAPHIFTHLLPDPWDVSQLAKQLMERLNFLAPDELWIPMGLGRHTDHRTTRSACLRMWADARDRFSSVPVFMYEDLPYAAIRGHAAQIRAELASCGTRLVRATEDITDVFEEKLRVISIYASHFKHADIESAIRRLAEREGGAPARLGEAYHRLEGSLRRLPAESNLSQEWAGLTALEARTCSLLLNRAKYRHLTVLTLPCGNLAKWKIDSGTLLKAFPDSDFRVYIPENAAWQVEEGGNDRLTLKFGRGGWRGWLRIISREFFHFRDPVVVLWRGAYAAPPGRKRKKLINILIRLLLPLRPVLLARAMSDFCCVLSEHLDKGVL